MKTETTSNSKKEYVPFKLPFFIGSDPEFLLFFGTRALDANLLISSFFANDKYVNANGGFIIPNVGNFGWDGAASTGELRPVAVKTIDEMVVNLKTMLETISAKAPTVDITTLSIGSPIGGHIHVDSFLHSITPSSNGISSNLNINNRAELARVENILSTYLLPLTASDHRISALNRIKNGGYGKLTDYRYEKKGNNVTCEIRGLTAEWLSSPLLTRATFAYIVTVWNELKTRNLELSKDDFICKTKEQNNNLQRLMLGDYKIIERGIVSSVKDRIKTFELYPTFKDEIDFILDIKKVIEHKADIGWNINKGWNLNKFKIPTKKDIMSPTRALAVLRKQNIPDINEHFGLMYNDDYNVGLFSSAISERIAGLNWQLKNDYFLFGFKKDVNGYCAMNIDRTYFTVPTNTSTGEILNTMVKMQDRSIGRCTVRIDPKTGLIRKSNNNSKIIIGIPYEDRANKNPAKLIELIYNIENKKLLSQPMSAFESLIQLSKTKEVNLTSIVSDQIKKRREDFDYDSSDESPIEDVSHIISELNSM